MGKHGKSVRLLPALETKHTFRGKKFTPSKSVVTVNQLLTVLYIKLLFSVLIIHYNIIVITIKRKRVYSHFKFVLYLLYIKDQK